METMHKVSIGLPGAKEVVQKCSESGRKGVGSDRHCGYYCCCYHSLSVHEASLGKQ